MGSLKKISQTGKDAFKTINKNRMLLLVIVLVVLLFWCYFSKGTYQKPSIPAAPSLPNVVSGGKPKLMYTPSCGYSRKQLEILDNNNMKDKFNIINCQDNPEQCKGIRGVPAFDFNGKKISGTQSAEKLNELLSVH